MSDETGLPLLWVDFNNCDEDDAVRLTTPGTQASLDALDLVLAEGLRIRITDEDELLAEGVVRWRDGIWVCEVSRWIEMPG